MRDSKFAVGDRVRLLDSIYKHDAGDVFIVVETEDSDFDLYLHAEGDGSETAYVHRAVVEKVVVAPVGPLTLTQVNLTLDGIEEGIATLNNILAMGRKAVNFHSEK